ncbi:MAG: NFACT family protein, partial [Chloroflexi bacterium]|nr:NFACT family protein [Chloroflexota bacterium]
MNVDALTLWAVRDELRATVLGARVERVILAGDLALGFELYAGGRRRWLYASCHTQDARIHLTSERLVRPSDDVSPLLLLLRKYAKDGRLVSIDQPPLERVVVLGFETWHEGELLVSRLVVELMGRYSNLVLVDADGIVLDSAKRVTPAMNRVRVTLPRQPYVPPPPMDRADPTGVTGGSLRLLLTMQAAETPAWRALIAAYRAISPLVAREIVFRGTGSTETAVGAVADWHALAAAQADLFADAAAGRWEPSIAMEGAPPLPSPASGRGAGGEGAPPLPSPASGRGAGGEGAPPLPSPA